MVPLFQENAMNEKTIERKLSASTRMRGGLSLKLAMTGIAGIPDRLILLPGGKAAFAETKAPGKKPRALQKERMGMLTALGFRCFVIDSTDMIQEVLDEIQST